MLRPHELFAERYRVVERLPSAEGHDRFSVVSESASEAAELRVFEGMSRAFSDRARAFARLSHPQVPKLESYGDWSGRSWLVLRREVGRVRYVHATNDRVVPDAVRILRDVAQILDAAHRSGFFHLALRAEHLSFHGSHLVELDGFALLTHGHEPEDKSADHLRADDIQGFAHLAFELLSGRRFDDPTPFERVRTDRVLKPAPMSASQRAIALGRLVPVEIDPWFEVAAQRREPFQSVVAAQSALESVLRRFLDEPAAETTIPAVSEKIQRLEMATTGPARGRARHETFDPRRDVPLHSALAIPESSWRRVEQSYRLLGASPELQRLESARETGSIREVREALDAVIARERTRQASLDELKDRLEATRASVSGELSSLVARVAAHVREGIPEPASVASEADTAAAPTWWTEFVGWVDECFERPRRSAAKWVRSCAKEAAASGVHLDEEDAPAPSAQAWPIPRLHPVAASSSASLTDAVHKQVEAHRVELLQILVLWVEGRLDTLLQRLEAARCRELLAELEELRRHLPP